MFRKIAVVLFSLCFFNSAFAALAQSSGFYVEANVGSARDITLTAFEANLGYKINDFFATEGGAAIYSNDNSDYLFDLAIKGIFPFSNGINIFAKFGGAEAHGDNGFKPVVYYGAGIGYSFTPNLTGMLQWNTTTENNGVRAPNLVLVGLNYNF
jgi:hypothetical protein